MIIEMNSKPNANTEPENHLTLEEKRRKFAEIDPRFTDFENLRITTRTRWEGAGAIINSDFDDPRRDDPRHVFAPTVFSKEVVWLLYRMADIIQPDWIDKEVFYPLIATLVNEYSAANDMPQTIVPAGTKEKRLEQKHMINETYIRPLLTYIYDGVGITFGLLDNTPSENNENS